MYLSVMYLKGKEKLHSHFLSVKSITSRENILSDDTVLLRKFYSRYSSPVWLVSDVAIFTDVHVYYKLLIMLRIG